MAQYAWSLVLETLYQLGPSFKSKFQVITSPLIDKLCQLFKMLMNLLNFSVNPNTAECHTILQLHRSRESGGSIAWRNHTQVFEGTANRGPGFKQQQNLRPKCDCFLFVTLSKAKTWLVVSVKPHQNNIELWLLYKFIRFVEINWRKYFVDQNQLFSSIHLVQMDFIRAPDCSILLSWFHQKERQKKRDEPGRGDAPTE